MAEITRTCDIYELAEALADSDGEVKVRVTTGQVATALVNDGNKGRVAMPHYSTITGFEIDGFGIELESIFVEGSGETDPKVVQCFVNSGDEFQCGPHSLDECMVLMPLGAIGCERWIKSAARDERGQTAVSVKEALFQVMQAQQIPAFLQNPENGRSMEEMQELADQYAGAIGLQYDTRSVRRNGKGKRTYEATEVDWNSVKVDQEKAFEVFAKLADDGIPLGKSEKGYQVVTVGKGKDARYFIMCVRNATFCYIHLGLQTTSIARSMAYHLEGYRYRMDKEARQAERETRKKGMRQVMEEPFYSSSRADLFAAYLAFIVDARHGTPDFQKYWEVVDRDGRTVTQLKWRPLVDYLYELADKDGVNLICDSVRYSDKELDSFRRCPYALVPVWFRVQRELRYAIVSWPNAVALAELLTENGQKDRRRNRDTRQLEDCRVQAYPLHSALMFQKRAYDSIVVNQMRGQAGVKQFKARAAAMETQESTPRRGGRKVKSAKRQEQGIKNALAAFRSTHGR